MADSTDDFALFLGEDGQEEEGTEEGFGTHPGRRVLIGEMVIECPVVIEFVGSGAPALAPGQNDWVFGQITEVIRQA
jgi:hypothetical protein